MKGTRHSKEQIITILKQGEAGLTAAELCREHGISEQTYYRWKAKYGGMESGDAKKLKQLKDENRKLKHVVAELTIVCTQSGPPLTRHFHSFREVSPPKAQVVPCRPLVPDFSPTLMTAPGFVLRIYFFHFQMNGSQSCVVMRRVFDVRGRGGSA